MASQKYHKFDVFLTFTYNMKLHFGTKPIKNWIDAMLSWEPIILFRLHVVLIRVKRLQHIITMIIIIIIIIIYHKNYLSKHTVYVYLEILIWCVWCIYWSMISFGCLSLKLAIIGLFVFYHDNFQSNDVRFKLSSNIRHKISEYYLHTINVIQIW